MPKSETLVSSYSIQPEPLTIPGLKVNGEHYQGDASRAANAEDGLNNSMPNCDSEANFQAVLESTYLKVLAPDQPQNSDTEGRINSLEDRVLDSPYYNGASTFYNNNTAAIKDSAGKVKDALESTATVKAVEDGIRTFAESSKVLMKMLDEVAKVHPFIGVAVLAFKAVVTLELKRRDNDKKVIALKVEMKDMISILLQLRYVRDSKQLFPDGTTLEGRMQQLMKDVADDITNCGNICDAYTKKSLVAKVFKGPIWENRLADFADTFAHRRQEIELALSIHTTLGVDYANHALTDLRDGLRAVHNKLDLLLFYKKLETPGAREIIKFTETKGGQGACAENDDLLQQVILLGRNARVNAKDTKDVQPLSVVPGGANKNTGKGSIVGPHVLAAVRNELLEDIDKTLTNNMELFDRKLKVQQKQLIEQLDSVVHREGDRIITAVVSGSHDRLLDPDLHKLWKEMGWKGSVKARHFILALHDYFMDKFSDSGEDQFIATPMSVPSPLPPDEYIEPGTMLDLALSTQQSGTKTDDRWALAYINIARVQPILEAFDDDGSGFVSIKEANAFTSLRPKGWSLPHWLAYWAAGWHSITWEYSLRIKRVIQTMYDHLPSVHPSNRSMVDLYLDAVPFQQVEYLCTSVAACEDVIYHDTLLDEKIRPYMQEEQARIEANLESVGWNIDATNTLALVVGPGRIERYIFPLLYVLLKHHLKIIKLACKGIFAENDLSEAGWSVARVINAANERIANLEAHFKQKGLDIETQFGSIAFGMFRFLHTLSLDEFGEDRDSSYDSDSENVEDDSISPSILKHGYTDRMVDYSKYETPHSGDDDSAIRILTSSTGLPEVGGIWSGIREEAAKAEIVNGYANYVGPGTFFCMNLSTVTDEENGSLKGDGFEGSCPFTVEGKLKKAGDEAPMEISFTRKPNEGWEGGDAQETFFQGHLDPETAIISGEWSLSPFVTQSSLDESSSTPPSPSHSRPTSPSQSQTRDSLEESSCDQPRITPEDVPTLLGTFRLIPCPPYAQRYRYTSQDFQWNPARTRWQFAGAAVLHQIKRSRWSWEYFKLRADDRKHFIRLWKRKELARLWAGMETSLGDNSEGEEEREKEIERLLAWTSQADLTYWKSLANEEVRNFPVHSNVYCDSCGITMLGTRITCLSCNAENFRQEIDLCVNCFGTEIVTDKFAHEEGHPSVKLRKVVHNKGNGSFIRFARKASERASDILRLVGEASGGDENGDNPVDDRGEETEGSESEPSGNRDEDPVVAEDATTPVESEGDLGGSLKAENNSLDEGDKTDTSNSDSNSSNSSQTGDGTADFFPRPRCVGCDNEIQAPCWYCVTCDTDAFVCDDCDSNDKSTFSSPHELSHPIVRCHGPPNVKSEPLRPAYEDRMVEMDTKIAALNERLAGLEKKLEGSQNGLTEKLAGIEALLGKVLSRLAA